jgi:glycosyltransferase involved in cell wall biosynthesis
VRGGRGVFRDARRGYIVISMRLSELLTIVIPCRNESKILDTALTLLNYQRNIRGVRVVVSDSSDDDTLEVIGRRSGDLFDLKIIEGGLPGRARNRGVEGVETPYVLFMDADMFVLDDNLLNELVRKMQRHDYDLMSVRVRTVNGRYNYVYRFFDAVQWLVKWVSPFCLGGFMLFRVSRFKELGGFDETVKVAEDYLLSKRVRSSKFRITNRTIFTSTRRFDNKGLWYMLKLMVLSFFNRNNKKFFSDHKTYWQ